MEPRLGRVIAIQKSEYDRDLPMSGARVVPGHWLVRVGAESRMNSCWLSKTRYACSHGCATTHIRTFHPKVGDLF